MQHNLIVIKKILVKVSTIFKIKIKFEKYFDLELYFEKQEDKLIQFIFELKTKLKVDVNRYVIVKARLLYDYSRFINSSATQIISWISTQHDLIITMKQMINLLKQFYEDLNKQDIAQRHITNLKMKNQSFMKYFIKFQHHIKVTKYDITTRKFNLKNKLFNEFKELFIHVNVSSLTYDQLIIKC